MTWQAALVIFIVWTVVCAWVMAWLIRRAHASGATDRFERALKDVEREIGKELIPVLEATTARLAAWLDRRKR